MWTQGKDKARPGMFAYELWDGRTMVSEQGGFATAQGACRAAEQAQRAYLFPVPIEPCPWTLDNVLAAMSDDDLLAELEA